MQIPEVRGKISNRRVQRDYFQQNRRSRKRKTGVWSVDLGFLPHFRNRCTEVCGKFRNPRARRPFPSEKPQVEALRHLGVHGIFLICRILPVFASVADCVSLYSRLDNEQNSQFRLNTKTPAGAKLLLPALVCLLVLFFGSRRGPFWTFTPPWAPCQALCARAQRQRRWPCPCRSTCSRPGDRQRSRRPPAPPAPRTACRGPRSWRR